MSAPCFARASWLARPRRTRCARRDTLTERTLANGLRVIVKADRRAPVVVDLVWYRVGSIDEMNGATGVAHVLEHMMFKGTQDGRAGRVLADHRRGRRPRQRVHQPRLHGLLPAGCRSRISSSRCGSRPTAWRTCRSRRTSSRRRSRWSWKSGACAPTTGRARSSTSSLMATALQVHPYRNPVIGWMSDLENMTRRGRARLLRSAGTRRTTRPGRRRRRVGGARVRARGDALRRDQDAGAARAQAPGRAGPGGRRRVMVKAPAELPYLLMAYKAPVLRDVEQGPGAVCARDARGGARRQRGGAAQSHAWCASERIANRPARATTRTRARPGIFYARRRPGAGADGRRARAGAARASSPRSRMTA